MTRLTQAFELLLQATAETLYMVLASSFFAVLGGGLLGIFLYLTESKGLTPKPFLYRFLSLLVDIGRSVPFAILMILTIPLSRLILQTSIGTTASIIPLILSAIPFYARIVETNLKQIDHGLIEAVIILGANTKQVVKKVLIPEALPGLISGIGLTMINLVGYSAMAGLIGGGGLGKIAIQYGYYRYNMWVLVFSTVVLVLIVGIIQWGIQKITSAIYTKRG